MKFSEDALIHSFVKKQLSDIFDDIVDNREIQFTLKREASFEKVMYELVHV